MGEAKIPGGYFKNARKMFENELWIKKPAWYGKVWIWMIGEARYSEDTKLCGQGEFFTTYQRIYDCNGLAYDKNLSSPKSIDNFIRWLKSRKQIETRQTTRGLYITVCNYYFYQDERNYKNDAVNEAKTKHKRSINDTISKEGEEREEGKEDIVRQNNNELIEKIVVHLNKVCRTKFRSSSQSTKSKINARLREGFSEKDFYTVINLKASQWLTKKDMSAYLRPETLFGTKFESYLNEATKAVIEQSAAFAY